MLFRSTVATLRAGTDSGGSVAMLCGSGVTLTTVVIAGAVSGVFNSGCTTFTCTGKASSVEWWSGAPATLRLWSGVFKAFTTGTIATELTVGGGGTFDRSMETRSMTVTPVAKIYAGGRLLDPNGTIVWTAGFTPSGCTLADIDVTHGFNRTYTVS